MPTTTTATFYRTPSFIIRISFIVSFVFFLENSCFGQFSELTNRNIYNSQLSDPDKSAKGRYYPVRFTESPAINNNWRIEHDPDERIFPDDTFSDIYDYRIYGDSIAVVVGRKIIKRVVPVEALQDSLETAIYYYFRKEPGKNHKLSVTRLHYDEFDQNGYIGVTNDTKPAPETFYISIDGSKRFHTIDGIGFDNRTLHPSVSPGLFITQDETTDDYFCGLLQANILSNPFENRWNKTLFVFPHNMTLAGNISNLRFYKLSSTAITISSPVFAQAQPFYADARFTVVVKPGNTFSVFDRQDLSTKDINVPPADGTIEMAFVNPYSNNVIVRTKKGEEISYYVNEVEMTNPFEAIQLPAKEGQAEALSGNFLLYRSRAGTVSIIDMDAARTLPLGSYPNMQLREVIQWSASSSSKNKNRRIGNDSIFFVIDHDVTGSMDRSSTAFCLVADAETTSNPFQLKCKDLITGSLYEMQLPEKEYQPHYFLSHKQFLVFQPRNSTFYEVRNIRKSFGSLPLPANLTGNYVSIRPFIRIGNNWLAKAVEYKDGKEKIRIIKAP